MKSKIAALSKNEDFKNLLKKKKISNKYITLFFGILDDKNNKKLNISFVAKKKLIRGAVKRNKVKRRLRNIINEAVKNISINFNYSYLVIAKITMLNNEYTIIKDTLFKDIEKILFVLFEIPLMSPYVLKHSIVYSEHVGRYLHEGVK